MSVPSSGPRPSHRHRRRQSPVVAVILVVVGMVILFGAGYGLSRIIQGASSDAGGGEASPSASVSGSTAAPEPEPCVTVTVTPGAGLPSPAQVTTNVYNATDRAGLAASTAEELQLRGFVIGAIDNDPLSKTITAVAELRHGPSGESAAKLLAFYLPGAELVNDGRQDATVDTVLGAAYTAVAPQSEVDAALAAPSPSPSGPGCSPTATPTVQATEEATPEATPAASE